MQASEAPLLHKRLFIQRDYGNGMAVSFKMDFPEELNNKIRKDQFEATISTLNQMYAEAEQVSAATCFEGCMSCLTGYLLLLCVDTHYSKVLKKVSRYIDQQNKEVYNPNGVLMKDPFPSGLRSIEFEIHEVDDTCAR